MERFFCPKCNHEFVQGESNYNYVTALLDFECPECGWTGDELQADWSEIAYDELGQEIQEGDTVIWTDPETHRKTKYTVVGTPNSEMVKLSNKYGYCEALPEECLIV